MDNYQYSQLLDPKKDIRLLRLLPGHFDEDLRAEIIHVALVGPPERKPKRLSLDKVQATLSSEWEVRETLEGRYVFKHNTTDTTRWDHPDLSVSRSIWELESEDEDDAFEPSFEALSYTWGAPDNPQVLRIQSAGHAQGSPGAVERELRIQPNLAEALRYLRYTDTVRTVWADAVCINQDDILERNNQVTRMADIYRLAHRVVIWLGPESANSPLAMTTLAYLGSQVDFTTGNFRAPTPEAVHRDWYISHTELPYDEATWRAVLDLLYRPWFDRLWVMQEVQLAHRRRTVLCCGRHAIPWSHVRRAVMTLGGKTRFPIPGTKARIMRIRPLVLRLVNKPLHSLLAHIRDRHCSDPRDKIYGILSIVPGDVAARIHPDYSAAVADVYRDAFLVSTAQTQRIRFYSYSSSDSTKPVANMPSWVPDWTAPVSLDNTMYAFCSSLSSSCATFEPPDILRVWGVPCGTISAVSQPLAINGSAESMPHMRDWSLQHALVRDIYPTGETSLSALAATLLVGSIQERFAQHVGILPHVADWTQLLSDYVSPDQSAGDPKRVGETIYSIFFEECQLWLFQTSQGYLGMTGTQPKLGEFQGARWRKRRGNTNPP